jgi:glycosyltransferase involved in cell wall biosynthesis
MGRSDTQALAPRHRLLVISHAHPDFSLGGGEIAAYNLFLASRGHPAVAEAWFLARADRGRGPTGSIGLRRPNEYLWEQAIHDWHMLRAAHPESVTSRFVDLIRALRPTIVHAHHFAHLGLEYLRVIKRCDPDIRLFLTLHEYMAICRNNGQMIKTGSMRLCSNESPDDCRQCFPEHSAEDFWLRKHFVLDHFRLIDGFIAPSEFLRQRYIRWGIPADRIVVIENGQSAEPAPPARALPEGGSRNRFGFFGQVNQYKGIDLLLESMNSLSSTALRRIMVEIHGANLEHQDDALQTRIRELAAPLLKKGALRWMGPYRPEEQRRRMAGVDWVLVPSTWWENSPMVIQEAFACGRPVIASDIGGMAEKVTDGVDGIHVPARNPVAWGEALLRAASTQGLWERLAAGIRRPPTVPQVLEQHLARYEAVAARAIVS